MQKAGEVWKTTRGLVGELRKLQKQERAQEIKLKQKMQELMAIRELGRAARSVLRVEELAKKVIEIVTRKIGADLGSVMFIDKNTKELIIIGSKGIAKRKKERYKLKSGEGLAGWCARNKRPIHVLDMEKDKRFKRTSSRSYRKREFMGAPFICRNSAIGVINLERERGLHTYTTDDMELLTTFIDETVACFENAFLFESLQKAYYETIRALVIAMEAKDPYMYGHGERVAKYAVKIAKALGLGAEEIKVINYFSILHDIGKIGVPEEILAKPAKLTSREWDLVRKHPVIGENIIEPIEFLKPVRPLLRHHHEWYNGRGYPDKLKGEDISIAARVLAVADAFDAMQADRPYRKAFSTEKAIREIKKGSGTQFDPKVIKAFIKVLGKKKGKRKP